MRVPFIFLATTDGYFLLLPRIVLFFFNTDLTDLRGVVNVLLWGPQALREYVTGICSRHVLAFPSDRLTHILPLAGHHKSTIITNDTNVLWELLRNNLTDSCPTRTSSNVCWIDGLWLINRKHPWLDFFPSDNGRPDRRGGSGRQARLHGWTSPSGSKGVSLGKGNKSHPSNPFNPW